MKLFANGCSFTWGGEIVKQMHDPQGNILDEHNTSERNLNRLQITWPGHLARELGCEEFHNYAMGCGSNARIVRKTLEFFLPKIINADRDLTDYVAVIQWTEPMRYEYFDDMSQSWALCKPDVLLIEQGRHPIQQEKEMAQSRFMFENDETWCKQTVEHISMLGNFFKQHGIRHLFTAMSPTTISGFGQTEIQYCNSQFNWYRKSIEQCSIASMQIDHCENSSHPSLLGHEQIARRLAKQIKKGL